MTTSGVEEGFFVAPAAEAYEKAVAAADWFDAGLVEDWLAVEVICKVGTSSKSMSINSSR